MKNNDKTTLEPSHKLMEDLRALVTEAETLLCGDVRDTLTSEMPDSLRTRFDRAQNRFGDLYADTRNRVVAGAKGVDTRIRSKPYQSLGIAAGIGLLLGVVLSHRSKKE